jgi:hypothetical protein
MFASATLRISLACPALPASHLPSFAGGRYKCMNPFILRLIRAHSRHDVTHQNRPFSSLRATSISVAALNVDDTTFSMSSNVIIFMVNLRHLLPWEPTKNAFNVAQCDHPVRGRLPYFIPHPSSFIPSNVGGCATMPIACRLRPSSFVHRPPSTVHRPPSFQNLFSLVIQSRALSFQ